MTDITPKHLRCTYMAACPSIHKLDDGRLLIVGEDGYPAACRGAVPVGTDEAAVIISPDLLADVEREWRTIDSAPKDGTEILVWNPGVFGKGAVFITWYSTMASFIDATHWMPLPKGPQTKQGIAQTTGEKDG